MSDEHANALIALSRRLRTLPAKDLPLVPRAVLLFLAARANEDGIAWPKLETLAADAGTTTNTVRRALDLLIGAGWVWVRQAGTPRDSARLEVRLEPAPPPSGGVERYQGSRSVTRGITERHPRDHAPRDHTASPQGSRSVTRGITERGARDHAPSPEDHRKDPKEDHREDPIAREGGSIGPLFGPSPAALETPAQVRAKKGSGEAKKKLERTKAPPKKLAEDRYADAFEAGQKSQGFPITPLAGSDKKLLGTIAAAHARYRDDTPITGKELVQWFYQRARDFRGDKPDTTYLRGGSGPIGFRTWLDNGGDGKPRPLAPGQEEPDEDDEDEANFPPLDARDLPPADYVPPTNEQLIARLEGAGLHTGAQALREQFAKEAADAR